MLLPPVPLAPCPGKEKVMPGYCEGGACVVTAGAGVRAEGATGCPLDSPASGSRQGAAREKVVTLSAEQGGLPRWFICARPSIHPLSPRTARKLAGAIATRILAKEALVSRQKRIAGCHDA